MRTYTIHNSATGEDLATGLTADEVEAWWKANEDVYYGLRVEGDNTIIVSDASWVAALQGG